MTTTAAFLNAISVESRNLILNSVANHYGISSQEAFEEITHAEAEHLLEYLTGLTRTATSVLMQKYGMR